MKYGKTINKSFFFLFSPVLLLSLFLALATSCRNNENKTKKMSNNSTLRHVKWSRQANIYEVNIRQYTPEGTFKAFERHLPRLKKMGVDILWLMPVFPIGEKNRKGSLGSYYAVKDYLTVNPEFGTLNDLKALVDEAHSNGMHVILDWVANHTAWDNVWTKKHPDWYEKDEHGNFKSPYDWTDVIELNFNNKQMRAAMISAMRYWLVNADVDGFRCDVAGMVPTDFWNEARRELDTTKQVFMLAEDEDNVDLLKKAFDMNYTWKMMHLMNDIAKGNKQANSINGYMQWNKARFKPYMYRMYFTSNHDENSWNGTCFERLGDAFKVFTVFDYTIPGMPLTYSGQEAGNKKRLRFFAKDTINWSELPYASFYTRLNQMKHGNKALWNGLSGGSFHLLSAIDNKNIFAFYREKEGNIVVSILNFSDRQQEFKIDNYVLNGKFKDVFSNEIYNTVPGLVFHLPAWGFVLLEK